MKTNLIRLTTVDDAASILAGIISLWDADKEIIEELGFQVEQLIKFVTGFRKALTKDLRKL